MLKIVKKFNILRLQNLLEFSDIKPILQKNIPCKFPLVSKDDKISKNSNFGPLMVFLSPLNRD